MAVSNEGAMSIEDWFSKVAKGQVFSYCLKESSSDSNDVYTGVATELIVAGNSYYLGFLDTSTSTVDYFSIDEISFSRTISEERK